MAKFGKAICTTKNTNSDKAGLALLAYLVAISRRGTLCQCVVLKALLFFLYGVYMVHIPMMCLMKLQQLT